MRWRRRLALGATSLLAAGLITTACSRARREAGLNVLLITIDTLRADALGASGNAAAATPIMDRLAREGVRFERAYAHNVVTLPSHANILSGRTPLEHGVRDNAGFRFPKGVETLATLLGARGYRTGAFVSAFPLSSRFGLDAGFEEYDDRFLSGEGLGFRQEERPGPRTVAAALDWLGRAGGAPSFLWVHLYEPHFPYRPPEPFASRFAADPYAGEVAAADAALGPLLAPLLGRGGEGRTLVILTGDHGESRGEHGERTHGIFAYDGTLRVPLVLYCPRLLRPRRVADPARHVDLVPTVLDALGLPAPEGLAGRSLLPMAGGESRPAAPAYFEALSGMMSRRWAPLYGVVRDRLKYIELPIPELYDLLDDPREESNLAAGRPREIEEMRALLARLRAEDRGIARRAEDAETRERLKALGYLASAEAAPRDRRYGPDDDPKRLIALDAEMQTVDARREAGDLPGALALCRQVVRRRPGMPLALVQLSLLLRETGDLAGALRRAEEALRLAPDDPQMAATLASHLSDAGRHREAADLLEPYARRAEPSFDVLMTRGAALASLGRSAEALAAFEEAREMAPRNALAVVNIGTVHLGAREYARAREALEAALALKPDLARAHNALGVIEAETGRPDAAVERWRDAVRLDPRDFDALFNLALMLRKRGPAAEARACLERFAREAPPALYAADIRRVRQWLAAGS